MITRVSEVKLHSNRKYYFCHGCTVVIFLVHSTEPLIICPVTFVFYLQSSYFKSRSLNPYISLAKPDSQLCVLSSGLSTYQVETQEVEDLSGVVFLQDLFQRVFDEPWEGLRCVLQGVTHEVVQRGPFR